MRKIRHVSRPHKDLGRAATAAMAVLVALVVAGCGSREPQQHDQNAGTPSRGDCGVIIDSSGWKAFCDLTGRIASHEPVSREDLAAFGDLPAVTGWRESQPKGTPSALKVANWLEAAFWEELGRTGGQKRSPDRYNMARTYRYAYENRSGIDSLLAAFDVEDRACELRRLAERWVAADSLPQPLVVHVLPTLPEIRIHRGEIYVDAGMLLAAGNDQLVRHLAALLFRKFETLPGDNPLEAQGEAAICETMRALMNEGVANYIEGVLSLEFRHDHPDLKRIRIVPEELFSKAQVMVGVLSDRLAGMFADADSMTYQAHWLPNTFVARNGFIATGYAMCRAIEVNLGEDRLRLVRRSVPGFIAAYQEAARRNPEPPPSPFASGIDLAATVPPLPERTFDQLESLLASYFPDPGRVAPATH